jgi:hypothetical protein
MELSTTIVPVILADDSGTPLRPASWCPSSQELFVLTSEYSLLRETAPLLWPRGVRALYRHTTWW